MPIHALPLPRVLNYGNPVNRTAPLNRGRVGWWKVLPQRRGGLLWIELRSRFHGTRISDIPWSGMSYPGGFGSFRCDGSADYVNVPDNNSLDFGNGSMSFAIWFRVDADVTGFPLCKCAGTSSAGYEFLYKPAGTTGALALRIEGGTYTATHSGGYNDSKWHHAVGVVNMAAGVTTGYLYVDGQQRTTVSLSGMASQSNSAALQFGARAGANVFSGWLDDATVYDRALSAHEVWQLYNASRTGYKRELNWLEPWAVNGTAAAGTAVPVFYTHMQTQGMA